MDGLHAASAAPWKQTIGGAEYWMSPLSLDDWGVLEKRLIENRPDPLELAIARLEGREQLDDAIAREVLECAFRETMEAHCATVSELKRFMLTVEGFSLMLWLSPRKRQPEITEKKARELALQVGGEELSELEADIQGASLGEPERN